MIRMVGRCAVDYFRDVKPPGDCFTISDLIVVKAAFDSDAAVWFVETATSTA